VPPIYLLWEIPIHAHTYSQHFTTRHMPTIYSIKPLLQPRMAHSFVYLCMHPLPTFMGEPALPTATAILPRISSVHASHRATGVSCIVQVQACTPKAESTFLWSFPSHYHAPMKASCGGSLSPFQKRHWGLFLHYLLAARSCFIPKAFGRHSFFWLRALLPIVLGEINFLQIDKKWALFIGNLIVINIFDTWF
jgi:hypothetical protein